MSHEFPADFVDIPMEELATIINLNVTATLCFLIDEATQAAEPGELSPFDAGYFPINLSCRVHDTKPCQALVRSVDHYRRHDTRTREYLGNTPTKSGTSSSFDALCHSGKGTPAVVLMLDGHSTC